MSVSLAIFIYLYMYCYMICKNRKFFGISFWVECLTSVPLCVFLRHPLSKFTLRPRGRGLF